MAISLKTLASALSPGVGENRTRATIIRLNQKDDSTSQDKFSFQYFPESINDTMGAEYGQGGVPGGSLPLDHYMKGSGREISFTALFSSDMDLMVGGDRQAPDAGFTNFSAQLFEQLRDIKQDHRNVDIRAAVAWLRSFLLPSYRTSTSDVGQGLTRAPSKLFLVLPNSGIGLVGGDSGLAGYATPDVVLCVMTQCDVEWKAFFPSGLPRLAAVQLNFRQTPTFAGKVYFPGATSAMDSVVRDGLTYGEGLKINPYTLRTPKS